jgi:hypothetical protein
MRATGPLVAEENGLLHATACNAPGVGPASRAAVALAHGPRGVWVYQAFDWLNATYFAGALPVPFIQIAITGYSRCLGWTRSARRRGRPPVITLHPSLWGAARRRDDRLVPRMKAWHVPIGEPAPRHALDVLLHECIHVSVDYRLGGRTGGTSSHDNPEWIAEVNRLAPLLGFDDVRAARSKVKRVGKTTQRVTEGTIPFKAVAGFPDAVRTLRGQGAYYRDRSPLPFERYAQLDVTE